ncbi:protein FAR1-RELATED SEQUENCE 5-like [Amaranthus tricolor]|uniref:protein FAR1-RELATED SEQUENCE 5-like n=1 Tax=Amaranthus tricolor TaxID=29722 RepID=UPI002584E76C|nr:protein FAR1-RELATED SEQUENCE 5-like [Amaranthus tricolor]
MNTDDDAIVGIFDLGLDLPDDDLFPSSDLENYDGCFYSISLLSLPKFFLLREKLDSERCKNSKNRLQIKKKKSRTNSYIRVLLKKENYPSFFFDFDVDESKSLCLALWVDGTCRRNYVVFGGSISIDATYSINKYNLVFVPFTGVDNHKWCVTFAIGLSSKEDVASYAWLFQTFLNAMEGKQPYSIITDQDPVVTIALPTVYPKSVHKFCVWHIMKKLKDKVSVELRSDENFLKRNYYLVYNRDNEPHEFETERSKLLFDYKEHKLDENIWLSTMYNIRKMWVPAYFRSIYMGGLLRTTSRFLTLVELQMRFQSAMDTQRHKLEILESKDKLFTPPLKTPLMLEKYAASIYTLAAFYDFQAEFCTACFECGLDTHHFDNGKDCFSVIYLSNKRVFNVVFDPTTLEVDCSCKMFKRVGILCRHSLWVLNAKCVNKLSEQHVLRRWTKLAFKTPIYDVNGVQLIDSVINDPKKRMLGDVWNEVHRCVGLAESSIDDLQELLEKLKVYSSELLEKKNSLVEQTKDRDFEDFVGCKAPEVISIENPKVSSNKATRKESDTNDKEALGL